MDGGGKKRGCGGGVSARSRRRCGGFLGRRYSPTSVSTRSVPLRRPSPAKSGSSSSGNMESFSDRFFEIRFRRRWMRESSDWSYSDIASNAF
ncbi:hypothetical protein SASPL_148754 [Salvia splendens]|uniref:Uncharacterized protein n=1 Tax=Salvia splendens TaxID=180675 RepID=A0A8X8WAS4_SALSN|nr:hypothetical protein SASPL_148754 [Salvia splendens]